MNDLARFVQANEPQLLAYNVYFTNDRTRMSVLHINPDSASLERHIKIAGPQFPPIGEFIRLLSIDVYGRSDDGLVEGLRQKAKPLGGGTVRVHDLHAGLLDCLRHRFSSGTAHSAANTARHQGSATPSFSITSDITETCSKVPVIQECREMGRASTNSRRFHSQKRTSRLSHLSLPWRGCAHSGRLLGQLGS